MKPPKRPEIKPPMEIQTAADWRLFYQAQKEWREYEEKRKEYERRIGSDDDGRKKKRVAKS